MPTPLRFFNARAHKRICFDNGFVEKDAPMFVAKWNDLLVVARDATNFFVATEAQTAEFVEIIKNAEGEVEYCTDAPSILPQGPRFTWTVQCGRTCQDGCDETILFDRTVETKQEVESLLEELDGVRYRGPRDFIRVRGPGHYTIKRPKRVAQPQPAPAPTAEAAPSPPRRNQPSIRFTEDRFNYNLPMYWSPAEEQVTRNSRQRREQMRHRAREVANEAAVNGPVATGPASNQAVVLDTVPVPSSTATNTENASRNALRDLEWLERQMRDVFVNSSNESDIYGEPYSYCEYEPQQETVPSTPPSRQSAFLAYRRR
jgi:hypothetical protein